METLFLEYQRLMYSEINKILQNAWDTEDVMQATLVKLIDKIPELRRKEKKKLINYVHIGFSQQAETATARASLAKSWSGVRLRLKRKQYSSR